MNNSKLSRLQAPTQAFVIFDCEQFASLPGLDPNSLKKAAKEATSKSQLHARAHSKRLKNSSALNAIAKQLGIHGGFSSYKEEYVNKLQPFMERHGLESYADLCSLRFPGYSLPLTPLNRQKISERLFFGGAKPKKIFTGYNFRFDTSISDGHWLVASDMTPSMASLGLDWAHTISPDIVEHDMCLARENPNRKFEDINVERYGQRTLLDVIVGKYSMSFRTFFNLIGDTLISPNVRGHEIQLYQGSVTKEELDEEKKCLEKIAELFRSRISKTEDGWLEVIPYNSNLVFLKGDDGSYDFIFKNMRSTEFVYNFDDGALKLTDLPSCIDDFDFKRWHYFSYKGYRELDEHLAEEMFYEHGGTGKNYDYDKIIKSFYEENALYCCDDQKVTDLTNKLGLSFNYYSKQNLMVSDLITVDLYIEFMKNNNTYLSYRKNPIFFNNEDDLDSPNHQINIDNDITRPMLPVACTWYDSLAFIKWLEVKFGLYTRLMSHKEYIELRRQGNLLLDERKSSFYTESDNDSYHFPEEIDWDQLENGIRFVQSNRFAEWTLDRTCIRSGNLTSFYGDDVFRDSPLESTGAYKNVKIGFRVCYTPKLTT
ncbi:TPA: hypothetical protein NJ316_002176 [Vibrio parahaemolyticus]|nr:hypothetical protein [Vibrio parahaemolyticus]